MPNRPVQVAPHKQVNPIGGPGYCVRLSCDGDVAQWREVGPALIGSVIVRDVPETGIAAPDEDEEATSGGRYSDRAACAVSAYFLKELGLPAVDVDELAVV